MTLDSREIVSCSPLSFSGLAIFGTSHHDVTLGIPRRFFGSESNPENYDMPHTGVMCVASRVQRARSRRLSMHTVGLGGEQVALGFVFRQPQKIQHARKSVGNVMGVLGRAYSDGIKS